MSSTFEAKIRLLEDTIPSGKHCKTVRGRKGKCRELTDFRRTAIQLYQHARTDAERARADTLVAEIDRRRTELGQGGNFARQLEVEKALRPQEIGLRIIDRMLRLAQRLPADHPFQRVVATVMADLRPSPASNASDGGETRRSH